MPKKSRSPASFKRIYELNCIDGKGDSKKDWRIEDAVAADLLDKYSDLPEVVDLREDWWPIYDQGKSGACVGYATAYGLLHWLFATNNILEKANNRYNLPSARFVWMGSKETDELTKYPTSFIEPAGTQIKLALKLVRKHGCVTEDILPMKNVRLSKLRTKSFYAIASTLRIRSYHNLGKDLDNWRRWIAQNGPILTRLDVDETWFNASETEGKLERYDAQTAQGGHAVCLVGYDSTGFIVRNSWGEDWGHNGFAYASDDYAFDAFSENYGVTI